MRLETQTLRRLLFRKKRPFGVRSAHVPRQHSVRRSPVEVDIHKMAAHSRTITHMLSRERGPHMHRVRVHPTTCDQKRCRKPAMTAVVPIPGATGAPYSSPWFIVPRLST